MELYKLYSTVLVDTDDMHELCRESMKLVLGLILETSKRLPLTAEDFAYFLKRPLSEVKSTLSDLKPVLYEDKESRSIRVFHPSFLDYLEGLHYPEHYSYDQHQLHGTLARQCLNYLNKHLKFNICNFKTSFKVNQDVLNLPNTVKVNLPAILCYSALYWAEHLCIGFQTEAHLQEMKQALEALLPTSKLFFWLEILAILNQIGQGVSTLELIKATPHMLVIKAILV